jgi:hypothetical protein
MPSIRPGSQLIEPNGEIIIIGRRLSDLPGYRYIKDAYGDLQEAALHESYLLTLVPFIGPLA